MIHAQSSSDPIRFLDMIGPNSKESMHKEYLKCKYYQMNDDLENYQLAKGRLLELKSSMVEGLDYYGLLSAEESDMFPELKDYLVDHVLDYAIKNNDLFLIKQTYKKIATIYSDNKRYKDAAMTHEAIYRISKAMCPEHKKR